MSKNKFKILLSYAELLLSEMEAFSVSYAESVSIQDKRIMLSAK